MKVHAWILGSVEWKKDPTGWKEWQEKEAND
jgi:hypothetical protein